jgi:hypothetical protein
VVVAWLGGVPGCATEADDDQGGAADELSAAATSAEQPEAEAKDEEVEHAAFDPSLRAAFIRERQKEGGESYHVRRGTRWLGATNAAQAMDVRYEASRVIVTPSASRAMAVPFEADIGLVALGRDGVWSAAPPVLRTREEANRVAYEREGIEEWYVNGPMGVEQGFTLATVPSGAGRVELALDVLGTLTPRLSEDEASVELVDGEGNVALDIAALHVRDASNFTLPSSFAVRDGRVVLSFDDTDAEYPVEVDPLIASLVRRRGASDPDAEGQFGMTVVQDIHYAVVGAPGADNTDGTNGIGAAYVFKWDPATSDWSQTQKLSPSDSVRGSGFGRSLAFDANTLLVGAPFHTNGAGRAYVFKRSGDTFTEVTRIRLVWPVSNTWLGYSVAYESGEAILGAPGRDCTGNVADCGGAYVFQLTSTTAANGSVTWSSSLVQTLSAPTAAAGERFGDELEYKAPTLLVGAPRSSPSNVSAAGRVYAYSWGGSSFTHRQSISSPSPVTNGRFGARLSMDSGGGERLALIGEPGNATRATTAGAAYVFRKPNDSNTWSHQTTLVPSTGAASTMYGGGGLDIQYHSGFPAQALWYAAMGAPKAGTPVVLFARVNGTWSEQSTIARPSNTSSTAAFGMGIVLRHENPDDVVITAPLSDELAAHAGMTFFYRVGFSNGTACTDGWTCMSKSCVDGVCCNSACGSGANDCQACSRAAGGTTDGTCTALTAARAPTVTCRTASRACERAATCSSSSTSCPANSPAPTTTICRPTAGICDIEERCNGTTLDCPTNVFRQPDLFYECRPPMNVWDCAEYCPGNSAQCNPPASTCP